MRILEASAVALLLASCGTLQEPPSGPASKDKPEPSEGITLYISPSGDDAWSGRYPDPVAGGTDGPLATLEAARDALRALKAQDGLKSPATVYLREGTHRRAEPFLLTSEDSGTWDAPITYAAYPGERPILSGGRPVVGWEREGDLWVAQTDARRSPAWSFNTIWVNGEYRRPARFPNEGFLEVAGYVKTAEQQPNFNRKNNPDGFFFGPGDFLDWDDLDDALVVVLHSWSVSYHRIAELDLAQSFVRFNFAPGWRFGNWGPGQRYYIEQVRAALDTPGEWYLDHDTGKLYYWPRKGETPENTEVIVPVAERLIDICPDVDAGETVNYINIKGLILEHTRFSFGAEGMNTQQAVHALPAAIQAAGARYCSVEDCEIREISHYGIWFREGCRRNTIRWNHIHHLAAGGIRIGDMGRHEEPNRVTEFNTVDNNWIHDGGLLFPAAVGVWLGRTSYNIVSHNEISDLYYTGVSVGWSWGYAPSSAHHNHIEYNHIHHIGKGLLSDMGGIYCLGISPGTILRYNLIHDVFSYYYGGWGLYTDEGSTDILLENNIVYNVKTGGFHQHYGENNIVRNNIFAYSHEHQIQRSREEDHISFFFERNIVLFNNGELLSTPGWRNDEFRMNDNLYWCQGGVGFGFADNSFDQWRARGHDTRSLIGDPLFVDVRRFDFRLRPESPAFSLGFQPIETDRIGLYGESAWTEAPKRIEHDPSELPKAWEDPGFVKDWMVIGPFDNADARGHNEVFSPEQKVDFQAVCTGKEGKEVCWRVFTVPPWGWLVNLAEAVPGDTGWVTAYAVCHVESACERAVQVRFGCNDTGKLWLNDSLLVDDFSEGGHGVHKDHHVVEAVLPKGTSRILIKDCNMEGDWGFCLRLTDPDGHPIPDLTYSLNPD